MVTRTYAVQSGYSVVPLVGYFHKQFDNIISFLISTSVFLAINGSFKIFFSGLIFGVFSFNMVLMTFLATFSTYGLNRLTDLKEDSINFPKRAKFIEKNELFFRFSVVASFFLSLLLGYFESIYTLPILLFPMLIGILYSIRLSSNLPRLKDVTGVKNLTIALSWAVGTTFLPLIYIPEKNIALILLIFIYFFLKSYINSILFDIRDIEGDRLSGIRTIPVFLGRTRTKNLLLFLNSTLLICLIVFKFYFSKYIPILLFAVIYGFWYILHFCGKQIRPGKSIDLLVDGEFILMSTGTLLLKDFQLFDF